MISASMHATFSVRVHEIRLPNSLSVLGCAGALPPSPIEGEGAYHITRLPRAKRQVLTCILREEAQLVVHTRPMVERLGYSGSSWNTVDDRPAQLRPAFSRHKRLGLHLQ